MPQHRHTGTPASGPSIAIRSTHGENLRELCCLIFIYDYAEGKRKVSFFFPFFCTFRLGRPTLLFFPVFSFNQLINFKLT